MDSNQNNINTISPKVSIIIPFYNHIRMTLECVGSIAKYPPSVSFEVIIINDGSDNLNIFQTEKKSHPWLKAFRNNTNLGFARSCNIGAGIAQGRYLVFLNNDTLVLPGWLDNMIKVIESDSIIGVVGSKLLYADQRIQHAGIVFDEDKMPFHIYHRFPKEFHGTCKTREFQAVTGACFLIEADLFRSLGGFDEQYHNGFEDIDLCFRVRQKGRKIYYAAESCLYHLESKTRKPGGSKTAENLALYKERWLNTIQTDYYQFYDIDFQSELELPEPFRKLKSQTDSGKKPVIVIWGAGYAGKNLATLARRMGIDPDLFVDSDPQKWGKTIFGSPVFNPEYLQELKKKKKTIFVMIASLYFEEILQTLIEFGFNKETEIW